VLLNAGILIIGSLLWDKERQGWRGERLDLSQSELVLAPIRYGRRSGKRRGYTYTMVFSKHAPFGQARVVGCSHAITSADDVITEALHLWEAEELSVDAGRIASSWGCVALFCNPDRRMPDDIVSAWAQRVKDEQGYGNVSQTADEGRLISEGGLLQIDWPRRVQGGEAVEVDLLLVTANDPTFTGVPPSYPSVETIVDAWNSAAHEHVEYFWKNTENGITTFQDDEIRARLRQRQQGPA
jgi:hypothetical protein